MGKLQDNWLACKKKSVQELHKRISQYRGDDNGYQGGERQMKFRERGKRRTGGGSHSFVHRLSPYLVAHTFSPLQQPVLNSHKSRSGILAGERRVNTTGENVSAEGRQA